MIKPNEQFSENKLYIMDIIPKPINERLSRRKTPYSKRKILKIVKKRRTNKKKSARKRNK